MIEINATKQKILIIGLLGVLILAIVMIGVMFFGKKNDMPQKIDNSVNSEEKNSNQDQSKKALKNTDQQNTNTAKKDKNFLNLANNDVYGLKIKKGTNQIMFYQQQKILAADPFSGKKYSIGAYPFPSVEEFLWSNNAENILIKDTGDYYVYAVNSGLAHKFRYDIDTAIWNNSGDKIIYKYYNEEANNRVIQISDLEGNNTQTILNNIPYRKIQLTNQPKTENICYFPLPDARIKGKLFCRDLNGKSQKEYGGHYGQDYLWSPDGTKILTSFTTKEAGNKISLGVINNFGGKTKELSMATTVRKCVWSRNNIDVYCAVLGGAPLAIMLPNAWEEQIFNSVDTFWKINTQTGEKKRIVNLENMTFIIDSENLVLDPEEEFLFFVGRREKSLWRLKLR